MDVFEREDELAALDHVLADAADGRGSAVVLEGVAGIGKSRLVAHVRAEAKRRGFGRLLAVGDDAETALPWGVVRQLVERSTSRYAGEIREAILAGPAGRALVTIDAGADVRDDAALARTLHALWWVAVDLSSTRPLLITVDDAQWADVASQRFLAYLARRLSDLPVALVVATRPPQEGSGPLLELTTGRLAQRLTPLPLSVAGMASLVQRRCDDAVPAVAAALHAASGGNPFLAGQLLDELDAAGLRLDEAATAAAIPRLGPRTVSRALLGRLTPDAAALGGAAAVLGARGDLATAAALVGLGVLAAADAADELVAGHVLAGTAPELTFVHPVIREAVLAALPAGRRAGLHAAAAVRLHEHGAAVDRVAAHLVHAPLGTLPEGADVLRRAAATLVSEGDAATAVVHLRCALAYRPGDDVLLADLGRACLRAGLHDEARRSLLSAAATAEPVERARRLADASTATLLAEGPAAAAEELERLLEAGAAPAEAELLLEARLAVSSSYTQAHLARSAERLVRFAELPGATQDERTLLLLLAQKIDVVDRPAAVVADLVERGLAGGRYFLEGTDPVPWGNGLHALVFADGIEVARAELGMARERLRATSSPIEFSLVGCLAAAVGVRVGDVPAAEADAAAVVAALDLADPNPAATAMRATATRLGVLAVLERGDLGSARAAIDAFDLAEPAPAPTLPVGRLDLARAAVALAEDDWRSAWELASRAGEAELRAGTDIPALGWRSLAALAAQRIGDDTEALRLADEQLARARAWAAPTDVGAALRLQARLRADDRLALLEEAVDVLDGAPGRLELAHALADLGEALRAARRRADARAPLLRAAELAQACGATALQARAVDALAALGDRPRHLQHSGREALTASERRVAELAGGGRSNRDIAQDLFITPKTVENHLGRVYVKLGIAGRRELADALG